MTLPNPLCWLRHAWGLRGLLVGAYRIDGHRHRTSEVHEGCTVIVSNCVSCGRLEISWHEGKAWPDDRQPHANVIVSCEHE